MDKNSIATLLDYQASIERSFKKIEKDLGRYESSETSLQHQLMSNMDKEIFNIKNNLGLIRMEIANLKEDENQIKWDDIMKRLQSQNEKLKEKVNEMKKKKKDSDLIDSNDIDVKVDLHKMSAQEVMKRGDKILDADDKAIKNMIKVTSDDVNTMKQVNIELNAQGEKLENADKDLKDIDYSLKRASQQIKTMFKMYATDKLIMCLIIVIVIVIITIIIVGIVKGDKDKNKTYNTAKDIFTAKKN